MAAYKNVLVKATYSQGGFASQRAYKLMTVSGVFESSAPYLYFYNDSREKIKEYEGLSDTTGYIAARVINRTAENPKIWLPDGEVCVVNGSIVLRDVGNVSFSTEPHDVSIQS